MDNSFKSQFYSHSLNKLVFGDADAFCDTDISKVQEHLDSLGQFRSSIGTQFNPTKPFACKLAHHDLKSVHINSCAGQNLVSPFSTHHGFVLIPRNGQITTYIDKRPYTLTTQAYIIHPHNEVKFDLSSRANFLSFFIDANHLMNTAAIMMKCTPDDIDFENQSLRNLDVGNQSLLNAFEAITASIDAYKLSPQTLCSNTLEDMIYRHLVLLLYKKSLFGEQPAPVRTRNSTRWIQDTVDFIHDNLNTGITLTSLEEVSGVSARTLQYGFKEHFNMTPMNYIKEQRLEYAKRVLEKPGNEGITISAVCRQCGFSNQTLFTRMFTEKFGHHPKMSYHKHK